ncbi:MAG: class I SAM-dependent methyltransferase [Candidatus Aenigmatarchaeota archaeon]
MSISKIKQKEFYDRRYFSLKRALHLLESLPTVFYDKRLAETILNASNLSADYALEVGCGQGTFTMLMSKKVRHVVAIDISYKALMIAKFLLKMKTNCGKISFIACDAEHLPFRENIFDIVYSRDLLHHVSDSERVILEMKRVAKKGGNVVAVEANAYNPQMIIIGLLYFPIDKGVFKNTKSRLVSLFLKAGLSEVRVFEEEFLPRHILFEYRSPVNILFNKHGALLLWVIEKIENRFSAKKFLMKFSNYLIIIGTKEN